MTAVPMIKRRDALVLAGATLLAADGALAQAEWPRGQAIKLVVPFTAGSGTDVVARLLGEKLGPALGTSIVVDNRAGAGGTLGAALVAKAPPDGYDAARAFRGPCRQPGDLRQPELRHAEGLHRRHRRSPACPTCWSPRPDRFKDVRDLVEQAKSQARHAQLRLGRQRLGDAHECRGLPLRRRPAGAARAVQGNAGGLERDDGRPHRLVLRADGLGAVAGAERQAEGARRRHGQALRRPAAAADDGRGRRARLRVPVLGRPVRPGKDAGGRSSTGCTTRWRRS